MYKMFKMFKMLTPFNMVFVILSSKASYIVSACLSNVECLKD